MVNAGVDTTLQMSSIKKRVWRGSRATQGIRTAAHVRRMCDVAIGRFTIHFHDSADFDMVAAMRWSLWVGAGLLSTCVGGQHRPAGDCEGAGGAACEAPPVVRQCLGAMEAKLSITAALCERAWRDTRSEEAAVAGAWFALSLRDDAALERWGQRALPTSHGARILRFVADMQRRNGDIKAAAASLRVVLDLQVDSDPVRATNTAVSLLELAQNNEPVTESLRFARIAWEQAALTGQPLSLAFAAKGLVGILVNLGELSTADAVIERIEAREPPASEALRSGAKALVEAARGRTRTAIELFRRASRPESDDVGGLQPLDDTIGLILALLDDGQIGDARRELDRIDRIIRRDALSSLDRECRLAAAQAAVELAEGNTAAALASVERGLGRQARHAARVQLLNVRGDALARRGDAVAAEQAWKAAAESVEDWRASIPAAQLRSGVVAHHRHALESWLDSAGQRGDAAEAFRVTQRIIGRELLDRIRQREAGAPATVDDSVRDVEQRLLAWDRSVALAGPPGHHELAELSRDMVAIMVGARSVWAIRHLRGRSSIARVGERGAVLAMVDAYRGAIDDRGIAGELGGALFPPGTLPDAGALGAAASDGARTRHGLLVMLDRALSDIALAGLRVGDRYLVERAEILEVLAPDQLFADGPPRACSGAIALGDPRNNLAGAVDEVHAVAGAIGAQAYLGGRATGDVVRRGRDVCVLHVAAHSRIEDGRAAFLLADGALSANDIVNHKIAPRLAVVAACRSQVDDDPAGSLVAAFLAAGSPGVIGVKRAYDDIDGAPLLLEFYRRYRDSGERDPLRALAQAQRAAIASGRPPRAWATVSLFGVAGWIH